MSEHDEDTNELTYMVRDEPLNTHWLETAIDGAEQVTAEALRKAMDDAAHSLHAGGIAIVADNAPEFVQIPPDAKVMPKFNYTFNGWHATHNDTVDPLFSGTYLQPGWNAGAGPQWAYHVTPPPAPDPITEERIRAMVCKWLRDDPEIRAIIDGEQDSVVDVKHRRRVRQWDEGGDEWRGVLYRVSKDE